MLAVDRQELRARLPRSAHHERTGHDQRFLVRKEHALAGTHRGECGSKPGGADDTRHDGIRFAMRGERLKRAGTENKLGAEFGEGAAQLGIFRGLREHGVARAVAPAEPGELVG